MEEEFLNLIETHTHANVPRMHTLVKPAALVLLLRENTDRWPLPLRLRVIRRSSMIGAR